MIVLTNADAIELLECTTDPELGCNIGTEAQYEAACEMLATLQQGDNYQSLLITLVANQDPDLGTVITAPVECPTGSCPMPALPVMEQLG